MRRLLRMAIVLTGPPCPAPCWAANALPRAVLILIAVILLTGIDATSAEPAPRPYRVLMLYPFNDTFWSSSRVGQATRNRFMERRPGKIEIYSDYLDLARFPRTDAEYARRTAQFLAQKYASTPLDLIVAIGPTSLRFAITHRDLMAPGVPLIFSSIARLTLANLNPTADIVGIASEFNAGKTFDLARRLQPSARHLLVIAGAAEGDRQWVANARQQLEGRTAGLETKYLTGASRAELLREVSQLAPDTIVLLLSVFADGEGTIFDPGKITEDISSASGAPVYAAVETFFGRGIVGGYMDSFESMGIAAADLGLAILAGEDPSRLASQLGTPHAYRVDARQLERWSLDWSKLPADTRILFKRATAWEQYRWQLSAVFATLLVQAAMITWLLYERHRRHLAELESRGRLREIIHLDRVAAVGAMSASIAHELNQPLGAILANAETAELLLAANPLDRDQLKEILADIRKSDQRAGDIIAHLRGLLRKRGEAELQEFDLNEALRDALYALDPVARKRGVLVSTHQARGILPVRADPVHLEQVMLNLATNAMDAMETCEPGKRTLAIRSSSIGDSEVMVSISDNGTGIPEEKLQDIFEAFYTTKSQGTGLGLSIVRTIVMSYGGKIWAENRSGGGAVFRFTLPRARALPA